MTGTKMVLGKIVTSKWFGVLLAVVMVVLTYPSFEPDYSVGIDASYVWGLNWLFDHDYSTLTRLVYPYGPLMFLKMPVIGWHFIVFLLFFTLCKLGFVLLSLWTARRAGLPSGIALVALLPACIYGNIDTYMVLDVVLLVYLSVELRSLWAYAIASLLAAVALTVKSSLGVQSCGVLFTGWIMATVRYRDWRYCVRMAVAVAIALLTVGMTVYHGFFTMLNAYMGILWLTDGYSESLVLTAGHPRIWTQVVFWVAMVAMIPLSRDSASKRMWLLLAIPLYANWKYGIVREDFWHFRQFLYFVVGFFTAVLVAQGQFRWKAWGCGVVAVFMLMLNLSTLDHYNELPLTYVAPLNGVKMTLGYKDLKEYSLAYIENAKPRRRLEDSTLAKIADGSVDCYPWEHVFVGANGLRWQPRVTVGCAFSPWLAAMAADNYRGDSAVDFILLHRPDFNGENGLRTIDGCYLLNDEPEVMSAILSGYSVVDSGWYGLLLKHRQCPLEMHSCTLDTISVSYGDWVDVPQVGMVRAEVYSRRNVYGKVADWLYKPDVHTVDYLMPDSSIRTYRFSPAMATEGLWAGPLVQCMEELEQLIQGNGFVSQPVAVRINVTQPHCHPEHVTMVWKQERFLGYE